MESILQIRVRNSECKMPKERRNLLTYPHPGLVPCTMEETEDECVFLFCVAELTAFTKTKTLEMQEKYRLLVNCADLEGLTSEYSFELNPDNMMYDRNLCVKVLLRDKKDALAEVDFIKQYRALVAAVLFPKYSYEDYYYGGENIYKKKRGLKEIQQISTTMELQAMLIAKYESERQKTKTEKKLVRRSHVLAVKIGIPLLLAALGTSVYFFVHLKYIQVPYQGKLLDAYAAYLSSEYVKVEDTLQGIPLDQLPVESKYILARSYIFTEGLTPAQRDNLLAGIGLNTDTTIFEYWIELGRCEFEQAVDTAKRLGDEELLLYAYIKQSAYVKADATMSGEEKSERISQLEDNISNMSESMAEEKAEIEETTRAALEIEETTGELDENADIIQ